MRNLKANTSRHIIICVILFLILLIFLIFFTLFSTKTTISQNTENQIVNNELELNNQNTLENDTEAIINSTDYPHGEILTTSDGEEYSIIANLNIPSLGIEYPILSNYSDSLLKIGLTKYWGSNPNQVGNLVILGHNYKSTKFFSKLPNIKIGDIVQLTDLYNKTLNYSVYATDIVSPDDNSCTSQKTNGNIDLTLITCYYDNANSKATRRFVVKARALN